MRMECGKAGPCDAMAGWRPRRTGVSLDRQPWKRGRKVGRKATPPAALPAAAAAPPPSRKAPGHHARTPHQCSKIEALI